MILHCQQRVGTVLRIELRHVVADLCAAYAIYQLTHSRGEGGLAPVIDLVVQVGAHGFEPVVQLASRLHPARQQQHAHDRIKIRVDYLRQPRVLYFQADPVAAGANPGQVYLGQ